MSTRDAGINVDPQTGHVTITAQDQEPAMETARQARVVSRLNEAIDEVVADIEAGKIDLNDLIVGDVSRRVMDLAAKMAGNAGGTGDAFAERLAAAEAKIAEIDKRVAYHDETVEIAKLQYADLLNGVERMSSQIPETLLPARS